MRRLGPLLLLALVLTGCSSPGGGDDKPAKPKLAVPEAGQCVAKEVADGQDVAPDFTTVVPCTEPHVYEVIQVRRLPPRFVDSSTNEAALARRTELAAVGDATTRRNRNMHAVMWPGCDQALRVATGVDRFTFKALDAKRLRVNPVSRGLSPWLTLAPEKLWTKHPVAVCSVRFATPATTELPYGEPRPVESKAKDTQVISTWMTPAFPQPFRLCGRVKGGTVACSAPHGVEYLLTADFKAAFGPRFLDGVPDLAALPKSDYETAVSLCRRLYRQTGNRAPAGFTVNYRFHARQDDPDANRLVMSCVLQAKGGKDRFKGFNGLS